MNKVGKIIQKVWKKRREIEARLLVLADRELKIDNLIGVLLLREKIR
ncbi:MAG: hypothetical protein mread185_000715 [Mycoplasmataceae bacterium]|nr:MAG: hypothetical protein mread185_000715 [Mycoplasmataceae bacterium]